MSQTIAEHLAQKDFYFPYRGYNAPLLHVNNSQCK